MTKTEAKLRKQLETIEELRQYDHCFIGAQGVMSFTEPFGFMGRTYKAVDNRSDFKGLTLEGRGEGDTAIGQDAHQVALEIAEHLGLKVPDMFGIGSQLRVACDVVGEYLSGQIEEMTS